MRRICSFHGFLLSCWISLRLSGAGIVTDYLLLEAIQRRKGANTIRNKSNIKWNISLNEIREKIKSVASALFVIDFEHSERAEGERAQKELSGRQYRAKRE